MKSWKKCVYAVGVVAMFTAVSGAPAQMQKQETAAAPKVQQVKIDNFAFTPTDLTVPVGTTVEWVNHDDIPHTVVSDDNKTFRSKALDTDNKFSTTFTQPRTYTYFCSIHPKMTGKIIVQ
jgi:plastocyanin